MAPRRRASGANRGVLTGVSHVLVDGRNLQFALRRTATTDLPQAALVARLRSALAGLEVRLIFDGHPAGGPQGRLAPGFTVEFGRHRDADSVIGDLVLEGARDLGPAGVDAILVVSDDRAVGAQARGHGARVTGTGWLIDRIDRATSGGGAGTTGARPGTSIGAGRQPLPPRRTRSPRSTAGR